MVHFFYNVFKGQWAFEFLYNTTCTEGPLPVENNIFVTLLLSSQHYSLFCTSDKKNERNLELDELNTYSFNDMLLHNIHVILIRYLII